MIELVEFTIPRTAPGKNSDGMKTIKGRNRHKQEWMGLLRTELERLRLGRPIPMLGPLHVFITCRYGLGSGHETPNWEPFITEVVLDALRGGHPNYHAGVTQADHEAEHGPGWIVDDKDHHVRSRFAINRDKDCPVGTTVRLLWQPLPAVHQEVYDAAA